MFYSEDAKREKTRERHVWSLLFYDRLANDLLAVISQYVDGLRTVTHETGLVTAGMFVTWCRHFILRRNEIWGTGQHNAEIYDKFLTVIDLFDN
jgi:hypothetical protein